MDPVIAAGIIILIAVEIGLSLVRLLP